MKNLLLIAILAITPISFAGDLIYKSGFENTALVSGTISGLTSTGLVLKLESGGIDEELSITSDGIFVFFAEIPIGDTWLVSTVQFPNTPQQQSCVLTNPIGVMPTTGADVLIVSCNQTPWNWDEMNWDEASWN